MPHRQSPKLIGQIAPDAIGVSHEIVVEKIAHRGLTDSAGHRIAAVGTADTARMRSIHDLGPAGDCRERQAAGQPLGGRDDVWNQPFVLTREPGTGACDPGLNLVRHQ